MSVLTEFAIFPLDAGKSLSEIVSKVIAYISQTGFNYQLTSMGTIIETPTLTDALDIINQSYIILEPYSDRVYCSAKFDIQKDKNQRLEGKVASIEKIIGNVKK
ncbi:MAG: thiamine-binding protein [Bacteroidales bacterium]|nr:thiamine-binding protein [Bacteroidales bacterium]